MDRWNTTFPLGRPIFRGYVSFREGSCNPVNNDECILYNPMLDPYHASPAKKITTRDPASPTPQKNNGYNTVNDDENTNFAKATISLQTLMNEMFVIFSPCHHASPMIDKKNKNHSGEQDQSLGDVANKDLRSTVSWMPSRGENPPPPPGNSRPQ